MGERCRYDGAVKGRIKIEGAVPVCPEALGGLLTPRMPAEIVGGDGNDVLCGRARVLTSDGRDVTAEFIAGARATFAVCQRAGAKRAVLKSKSPSCGACAIYDGTFTRTLRAGQGVTAALLMQNGITVETE